MSTDLKTRLRDEITVQAFYDTQTTDVIRDALNSIESLEAENARLREALERIGEGWAEYNRMNLVGMAPEQRLYVANRYLDTTNTLARTALHSKEGE